MKQTDNSGTRAVATGSPAISKTSIGEALSERGYTVIPEAARELVDKIERGKSQAPPPWENPALFKKHLPPFMQELYHAEHPADGSDVIMDRHVIDIAGYTGHYDVRTPPGFDKLRRRFEPDIAFFPEPLPEYTTDNVRKECQSTAPHLHQSIRAAYEFYDVTTETVPYYDIAKERSVEERASFIEDVLS